MRELLVLLVVIGVIVVIWYLRKESAGVGARRNDNRSRRLQPPDAAGGPLNSSRTATAARAAEAGPAGRGAGLFQEAADSAAGLHYERAADQMEGITADLANARQDAEQAAARLANRASEALASVQAAAAAHGGAVPGDGTHDCPSRYPIKGNMSSMRYLKPGQPSYNRTIPDVCFQGAEAAGAAGFSEADDETGMHSGPVVVDETAEAGGELGGGSATERPRGA
jgi:hypothetical protein